MIELFNRLQEKFGARLRLLFWNGNSFTVQIHHWKAFTVVLGSSGRVYCDEYSDGSHETAASKWILAIAQGKTRDAEGKVA